LCDLKKYKINPNRFDKLWHAHRWELGRQVSFFDNQEIPPIQDLPTIKEACVLECQSGTTSDNNIFQVAGQTDYENVQFSERMDPYMYDVTATMDPTRSLQDSNDVALENFFSRPIKIAEEDWTTLASLDFDIDPWSLYFENPRVSNRLTNFNLLKANLKVKIVINGNGFFFGRMLVSYLPFDVYDSLSRNLSTVPSDIVQASQQPHVFLDPTLSLGGELKLPMFNYRNYISVVESAWDEFGTLSFRTLNQLKHANGAAETVTVSVFAWAEDVSMSVLTSVDQDTLLPQSGEIEQGNKEGMVSGPATSVAKFASYLNGVPYIGPFATATEMGATAVAKMAKIFGYCRPPITKNPEPYKPTQISSLALTNVPDGCQKVTVDDKQELSIDPRISGIGGTDPLNIREIAKRESYLTTFTWATGTAPDTLLWNARIDPVIWAEDFATPTGFHFPACAFAALPFQYWKGTMNFRFQIVCSNFHKGRLKIVYDPNFIANNTYLTFSEYNTNYLKVVDIAAEQDFTIQIGNGQDISYLDHHYPGTDSVTQMYSTTRYATKEAGNGVIGVIIVNELTTPNSTVNNDINVNVFVSMGDDFEVAVPEDYFGRFTFGALTPQSGELLEPQSGEIVPDAQETVEPSAPQHESTITVGPGEADSPDLNKVFFGEAISSFRTILKRYNLWSTIAALDSTATLVTGRYSNFPYFRGEVNGAVDATATLTDYNYVNTVMLHWVTSAYSGWRGSIRYKLIPRGAQGDGHRLSIQRAPYKPTLPNYVYSSTSLPTYANLKSSRIGVVEEFELAGNPSNEKPLPGINGSALTTSNVNGALEFEVPFYSQLRFNPGKSADYTSGIVFDAAWDYRVEFTRPAQTSTYDVWVAAGEDFQTYFFTGLPRVWYEPAPPA
jgi:hypothetical protein